MNIKTFMVFLSVSMVINLIMVSMIDIVYQTKIERTTLAHERAIEIAHINNKCK